MSICDKEQYDTDYMLSRAEAENDGLIKENNKLHNDILDLKEYIQSLEARCRSLEILAELPDKEKWVYGVAA